MIHPVGGFKKRLHVYDHVSKTLRAGYPDYYYKIVDLVRREGIKMTNKVYYFMGRVDSGGIAAAYKEEALSYKRLQAAFSLDAPILQSLGVKISEDVLQSEKGVLVPSIIRLDIDEYNLDQLDAIIVQSVESGSNTIDCLMGDMKQYFDAQEIEANPAAFEKLMIDTVKRLCYAGVLNILFEK
jgi:hypothetical protein